MAVKEWIGGFLKRHSARFGPHDWPSADATGDSDATREYVEFVKGWIRALSLKEIKQAEADEASLRLTLTPPHYRQEHIPMLIAAVLALRAEKLAKANPTGGAPKDPVRVAAELRCQDCPECGGSGMATRCALWHSIKNAFYLKLFCRCELGSYLKANDPDMLKPNQKRNYDDLQARPELWIAGLSHASWSRKPVEPDVDIEPECVGKWRYIVPGEQTPPAFTLRAVVPQLVKAPPARRPVPFSSPSGDDSPAF